MHHSHDHRRKPAAAALVLLTLALVLAACGSSSSGSTSTGTAAASASAGTSTSATPPAGRSGRFSALRECLAKNGITLPKRKAGQGGAPGLLGGGAGAGPQLPSGVSRSQFEAAMRKCGGGTLGRFRGGQRSSLKDPAVKSALVKFAACMRAHKINVPEPNTSGTGPVFDTKGIDTTSPQFKAAYTACAPDLRGAIKARPGATAQAPPAGSPPAGG